MPDKIEKALGKLSLKERGKLKEILQAIKTGKFEHLDVVKLKGQRHIYRVRRGDLRVIFMQTDDATKILTVERRSEKTYKNF